MIGGLTIRHAVRYALAMPAGLAFESREVVRLVGVPERALRHWADRGIVVPDIADAKGRPGIRRKYSFDNLVEAGIVKELLGHGINLHEARGIVAVFKRSLLLKYIPGPLFLIIEAGMPSRVLCESMRQTYQARLKRVFPKLVVDVGPTRGRKLGARLAKMLDVADHESQLVVAIHRIRDRLTEQIRVEWGLR